MDFDLTFYTGGEEKIIICLTFIGEIKNTDDFRWVFTNEIGSINYFPFHWVGDDFNPYTRNPFVWTQQFPFPVKAYNDVISFGTEGKSKKKEKSEYKPKVFFKQVVSGTEAKIEILKRNSKLGGFTTINVVVPLIIISTQPIIVPNLPPDISEIKEKEGILFMFRPTITPEINLWRIPILIVEQESVFELIKKLFVAILAQISQPYKRFIEKKDIEHY